MRLAAAIGAAVVAVVAALVVVGSSLSEDDPRPRFADPTSAPTSTETTSITPTSPPTSPPTTATEPPEESLGPEDTVRAWVAGLDLLLRTGDPAEARRWSAPDCDTCGWEIDPLVEVFDAGGSYEKAEARVAAAKAQADFAETRTVDAGVVRSAGRLLEPGETVVRFEERKDIIRFRLVADGQGWLVDRLVYVQ